MFLFAYSLLAQLYRDISMFIVKSILVPTDFSDPSNNALSYAKEIARHPEAVLHLLHVVEPTVYPADWGYSQVGFIDLEQELRNAAEKELDRIYDQLRTENFTVVKAVCSGRASDEIIKYVIDNQIDLISIATHGRSGIEHLLFGSTTERVLRKAPCPVLAVRIPPHRMDNEQE